MGKVSRISKKFQVKNPRKFQKKSKLKILRIVRDFFRGSHLKFSVPFFLWNLCQDSKKILNHILAATESAGINDVVSDVIKLVRNQRCVPRVKEEAALTLTMLLLSDPTSSIVIDMCQGKLKNEISE